MMDTMVGKAHVNSRVCLDSDMAGTVAACGGTHLDGQRWTHRRHCVYQEGAGEDRTVCPYSQQARDLELPRLFQRGLMTNIVYLLAAITACLLFNLPSSFLLGVVLDGSGSALYLGIEAKSLYRLSFLRSSVLAVILY